MRRTIALLIAVVVVSVAVFSGGAVSESFGISVADSIETPERTVDHDVVGEHTFSAVGVTTPGAPLTVSVTAPSGETHFLDLYKGRDRVDTIRLDEGSETVSMPTDGLDPGSYFLRIVSDGTVEALYPVVIQGYDISVERTNTATDQLDVSTTVTPTASTGAPQSVEVVVWNDDTDTRETLTHESGDSYTGTVSVSAFGASSYHVYVAAVGDETVYDRNEILAIGEGESVQGSDGSADDSTGEQPPDETATQEPFDEGIENGTTNDSVGGADNTTVENGTDDSLAANGTDDSQSSDELPGEPSDDESVIEPTDSDGLGASGSGSDTDSQIDDEVPLSPVMTVGALVASGLLAARRSR